MVSMGIDGSTSCTGYSFFDGDKLIAYGELKPTGKTWQERIVNLVPDIVKLVKQYRPDIAYIENVPLIDRQMQTLVTLGALQGMFLSVLTSFHVRLEFLLPNQWRSQVGGIFDGTLQGRKRDKLKQRAIERANELFGTSFLWVSPTSKKNQDDVAESILIAYSQIVKNNS